MNKEYEVILEALSGTLLKIYRGRTAPKPIL